MFLFSTVSDVNKLPGAKEKFKELAATVFQKHHPTSHTLSLMKTTTSSALLRRATASRCRQFTIEPLEARIAPASFTGAGATLTVNLNSANELVTFHTDGTTITAVLTGGTATDGGGTTAGNVAGFGTSSVAITSSAFTSITITDSAAGDSVGFATSTGAYPQAFGITLNDTSSGNVTFAGSSTFNATFNATTTAGFFASNAASSISLAGTANLALTATGHDVLLKGAVSVAGTTSLAANVVQLDNAANDFVGTLQLSGPSAASVFDMNDLALAATNLTFGSFGQTVKIVAGGNITQTGALTASASTGVTLSIVSTGGDITLGSANNLVANVALALSVTGTHTATFTNSPGGNTALTLGDTTLGTGALTLTSNGNIVQKSGTTIQTGGAVALTIASNNHDVLLSNSGNHIAGAVTVAESSAGFLRDVSFRNADDHASAPTGTPLTTVGDVRNLTLFFDNNGVALPGYNITGSLNVTTGGDITQTAAETIGVNTTVTLQGDFGIALTNVANAFSGAVSINAPHATQPIAVTNGAALAIGPSSLGRGLVNFTAQTGNITQTGGITEEKSADNMIFTANGAGAAITLNNANNRFAGNVGFAGAGVASVSIRNTDFQANFLDLAFPASATDVTVRFDNAPIVLPAIPNTHLAGVTNLTVNAQGIVQEAGTALVLTGTATFNANGFPLTLANAGNDFANVTLTNTGRNDVSITDVNSLTFTGTSSLGTGRLTVKAGGTINEPTATDLISQTAGVVGEASFTSTTGGVTLGGNNLFRGSFSASVTGANGIIVNNSASLTLGAVTTVGGPFAATTTGTLLQDPTSVLKLGGTTALTSSASSASPIELPNHTNTFSGAITLTGTDVALRGKGPMVIAASNVTASLDLMTGGTAADTLTQTGPINGDAFVSFETGAAGVTMTDAGNNFGTVSVTSTGAVSITDTNALAVGKMKLGAGALTITTGGNITTSGAITQTGPGLITLTTPAGSNITLNNASNVLPGMVNVVHSTNVNLGASGGLAFAPGSVVTGSLTATAGGVLALPGNLTSLTDLIISANSTTIGSDVTVTGGSFDVTGALTLTGARTLTSTVSNITLRNGVNVGGALVLNLATGGQVRLAGGDWNEGTNPLTITGTNAALLIGSGLANFNMTSGTISMPGNGNVSVLANATLRVGATSAAETVTLVNGTGSLTFNANSAFAAGLGATNDQLIKTGAGNIVIDPTTKLLGSGLAGASATPVLVSQTALLAGHFAGSVDASGAPHDFFAGSDIVTPAYDFTHLTVKAGGTLAPTGTFSGFLPDGDKYTVTSSLGASAGLTVLDDVNGALDIVVRNNTAAAPSTLGITASGGGDGRLPISGVMVQTPGALTINAPAGDFTGMLTTVGTLTAFTARDLGSASVAFTLNGGGLAVGKTSITAHEVKNTTVVLVDALDNFKAVSVGTVSTFTADKFGAITITGDSNGSNGTVPGTQNPGDFSATLTSTTATTGLVLSSATIAGTLNGTWDLRGSIGTIKAGAANFFTLGTMPSSIFHNGGQLTDVKSLTFGSVSNSAVNASGMLSAVSSSDIITVTLNARAFGTLAVKANPALGLVGSVTNLTLTATGNTAGVALKSLTVAGDMNSSLLTFLDGDVSALTVARTILNTTISGTDVNGHGNLKMLTGGRWQTDTIFGRTVGTLKSTGNLPAGIFGDFTNSGVVLSGSTKGIALTAFSASGSVTSSDFEIDHGNVTSFLVGRQLDSTSVSLLDPAFGNLATIQAGDWTSGDAVLAKTIGTIASVGAPAVGPASPLLLGSISGDTFTAFQNTGTAVAIGKLMTKGDFTNSTVNAGHGIGSATIGRTVNSSFIIADDAMSGALNVGRIATLTAGSWTNSTVSVNTFGTVKITGFTQPESSSTSFVFGDVTGGNFVAHGATPTKPVGIDSFSVARHFQMISTLVAPFGIKTFTVGGTVGGQVIVENPAAPASGFITSFTAGDLTSATIRVGSIGTMKVMGSVPFALLGNVSGSTIALNSGFAVNGTMQALGTLSVAGDFVNSVLDAPLSVGSIDVRGRITSSGVGTRVQAGYQFANKLGSLSAGSWGTPGNTLITDLVTQNVGTFTLKGNSSRGFTGTTDAGFIDILGNSGGIGIGTFTASGAATNSLFRVNDGDVTSFTALRLISTDVLVGFRYDKASDITATTTTAQWTATTHKLGTFKTTAPFDATDVTDSSSFVDSNVIAGILGSITISGVNPDTLNSTAFGVAFRTSAGAAAAGVVKTNGSATSLTPSSASGQFHYLGLAG